MPGLRVTIWRIFLGLLPLDTQEWESSLENNYTSYQVYVKEMIEKHKLFQFSDAEDPYRIKTEGMPEEEQKERKENAKILRMVEKDIKRTRQELSFFR